MIRVVIADDEQLVRSGFCALLANEPDVEVVAVAADGHTAVAAVEQHHPDVVLMDLQMPRLDGVAATRWITTAGAAATGPQPSTHVLVLTTFDDDDLVDDALEAGASGFLLKDTDPGELVVSLRRVVAGEAVLAPSVLTRLVDRRVRAQPRHRRADPPWLAVLTAREREVLQEVAAGLSNAEIAARLHISPATAKTHVARLLTKVGVRDRVALVAAAYEAGVTGLAPTRGVRDG